MSDTRMTEDRLNELERLAKVTLFGQKQDAAMELITEIRSLSTTIESLHTEIEDLKTDSTDQLFSIKALTDIESVHLQQIESLEKSLKGVGVEEYYTLQYNYQQLIGKFKRSESKIESQKEEIERLSTKIIELTADHIVKGYEIAIDKNTQQTEQLKKLNESIEKRLNLPEIESLKAITELAVNGFAEIKLMLDMDHSDYQKFLIWKKACDSLTEMERIQNE